MYNEYIKLIKEKMVCINQKQSSENHHLKNLERCNIKYNPNLFGYIFDKILDFKMEYRPMEKINYMICFEYKGKECFIEHSKFYFSLYIDSELKEDLLSLLEEVNILFEQALIEYSENAVKKNDFTLPNYYNYYREKINCINEEICLILREVEGISLTRNDVLKIKLSYLIELYIDSYFSYLEHLLILLFPMTVKYNENDRYNDFLKFSWKKKLGKLENANIDKIATELVKIKEVYRNRLTHGLFSREKLINIKIPKLGTYPFWVGEKYCKGYSGISNYLSGDDYIIVEKIFSEFNKLFESNYGLQMNIIKAGIPTFLEKSQYDNALENHESNNLWIEMYWHYQDQILNMDW